MIFKYEGSGSKYIKCGGIKMITYRRIENREVVGRVVQATMKLCSPDFDRFKERVGGHVVPMKKGGRSDREWMEIKPGKNLFKDLTPFLGTGLASVDSMAEKTHEGVWILEVEHPLGTRIVLFDPQIGISAGISVGIIEPTTVNNTSRALRQAEFEFGKSAIILSGLHNTENLGITGKARLATSYVSTGGCFDHGFYASEQIMAGWERSAAEHISPFTGGQTDEWGTENYYYTISMGKGQSNEIHIATSCSWPTRQITGIDKATRALTLLLEFKGMLESAIRYLGKEKAREVV
ncbi:hypothetical protein HYT84_04670 [Candidatus Micrarchaeota archaeon]|nr:hypothetical protein [Candidatus Micrarchaeota archaeon]